MVHLSLDSIGEIKEEMPTLPNQKAHYNSGVGVGNDKGKEIAESSPELISTSSERNYLQVLDIRSC